MEQIAVWIALGSLIVNFIAVMVTNQRYAVKNTEARAKDMIHLERNMREAIDNASRNFGETVSALREKMRDVELWNRDNFINTNTFNAVVNDMKQQADRLDEKLDRRFNELERKIEKVINGRIVDPRLRK